MLSETSQEHRHPVNIEFHQNLSFGQRASDTFAKVQGSWKFIIVQSIILVIWVCLNVLGFIQHWDKYPFILLNLVLSFQAAYASPIIMMAQNRQSEKDRAKLELQFKETEDIKEILLDLQSLQALNNEHTTFTKVETEHQTSLLLDNRVRIDALSSRLEKVMPFLEAPKKRLRSTQ